MALKRLEKEYEATIKAEIKDKIFRSRIFLLLDEYKSIILLVNFTTFIAYSHEFLKKSY